MKDKIDLIISKYDKNKFKSPSNFEIFKTLLKFSKLKNEMVLFIAIGLLSILATFITIDISYMSQKEILNLYYNFIFLASPISFSFFLGYSYLYDYQDNILDLIRTTPISAERIYLFTAIITAFKTMIVNILISFVFNIMVAELNFFNLWIFSTTTLGLYLALILILTSGKLLQIKTIIITIIYVFIPNILKLFNINIFMLYFSLPLIVHLIAVLVLIGIIITEIKTILINR